MAKEGILCEFLGLEYTKLDVSHPDVPNSHHSFIRPMMEYGVIIAVATVIWFILDFICAQIAKKLLPSYNKLKFLDRKDFDIRVVSVIHAFMTCFHLPLYLSSSDEDFDDFYGFHSNVSQLVICGSFAYFIYDLIVSVKYDMGLAFKLHAICCLFVCYFALYPFLHMQAGYFFGLFEISTIFNHWRGCMELLGNQSSPWYLFAAVLFAISFTLIRVVGGSYYSYKWQIGMYDVIMAGEHHSLVVYAFFSLCNAILMFLQYFWFTMIVQAVIEMVGGGKKDKKD